MAGLLIVPGAWPVFDAAGDPVSGATISFFVPGTTTPKAVYSDSTLTTSLGSVLTTNAAGEPTTLAGSIAREWWASSGQAYDIRIQATGLDRTWDGIPISTESSLVSIANITDLRASTWGGNRPNQAFLVNSWNAGDGGGTFRWDSASTATDDGGITIKETATATGRWIRQFNSGIIPSWFGAVGDGVADDTAPLNAAISAAYTTGRLLVELDKPTYRTTATITIGNGAEATEATTGHGIVLRGFNTPSAVGFSAIDQTGKGTRIVYDGTTSTTAAVVRLAGPITRIVLEDLQLDANNKAGRPLEIIHAAHCSFRRVFTHNYTAWGFYMTTRADAGGVLYATANNQFLECSSFYPRGGAASGIFLGSGIPNGTSLTGPRSTTRNTFIDCIFSYDGTSGTSCGIELEGASANIFTNVYLNNSNSGTAASVKFTQRTPDTQFPYENIFQYLEALQNIAGTSGTYGNDIYWAFGDGQPIPSMDNIRITLSDGRRWQGTQRSRDVRQTVQDATTTATTTTSTSYVDTDLTINVTCKDVNSILVVESAGQVNKVTGGFMEALLSINGVELGETRQGTNSGVGLANYAMKAQATAQAGTNTVKVRIRSSDANTASLERGTLIVQELY
jgi:hypothetical protein